MNNTLILHIYILVILYYGIFMLPDCESFTDALDAEGLLEIDIPIDSTHKNVAGEQQAICISTHMNAHL